MSTRAELFVASQQQRQRVKAVLASCVGPERALHIAEIARRAGVEERFCRNAYADFDGSEFVIAKCDRGLFVARTPEEAASFDAEHDAKLRTYWKRRRARRLWWKRQSQVTQLGFSDLMQRESA